jgi:predicted  nucleic acid-binding Zn-ribbon protein|nr:MAG TPA: Golgi-localized syntaxin-1-binding clamp [Caudoviricetes sp.]
MDGKGIWMTALTTIGTLGGFQVVKAWINRKTDRRKEEAETQDKELEILRKHIDWMEKRYKELSTKVDELYKRIHEMENDKIALITRNNELELALKEAKYNECRRPDDECLRRYPQREICMAKKLLGGYYDKEDNEIHD